MTNDQGGFILDFLLLIIFIWPFRWIHRILGSWAILIRRGRVSTDGLIALLWSTSARFRAGRRACPEQRISPRRRRRRVCTMRSRTLPWLAPRWTSISESLCLSGISCFLEDWRLLLHRCIPWWECRYMREWPAKQQLEAVMRWGGSRWEQGR